MPDRAQDTEAIRAALNGSSGPRVLEADAALGRLVARLEADEQALRRIAQAATRPPVAKRYAVTEFCDYVFRIARAALAAAAPGETTEPE